MRAASREDRDEAPHHHHEADQHEHDAAGDRRLVELAGGRLAALLPPRASGPVAEDSLLRRGAAIGTPAVEREDVREEQGRAERRDELDEHVVVEAHPAIVWPSVAAMPAGTRA